VSSPTRAPSHSPTSTLGNSHYSSPSFTNSTYSSAHPSPPSSVHRPPPILALVIDTPNTTPATPTHPFVHSPYTSTPTQILESATLVPQRSRHSSFSNTNVSPLTTAVWESHSLNFSVLKQFIQIKYIQNKTCVYFSLSLYFTSC
jgi:hypothetical protein